MSRVEARVSQDLLAEPHVTRRRIPVLTIVERVEGRGLAPQTVADRHDLDVSEVYAALLYYHEHPQEFEELRRDRAEIMADVEAEIGRPDDVDPSSS